MSALKIDDIKSLFAPLKNKYDILLYGSHIKGGSRPNSDIDIAILTHLNEKKENILIQKNLFGQFPLIYDVRVFELLPIHIQISIIQDYSVIYGNSLEISEYLYYFRKKWNDCKHRILSNQFSSYHERAAMQK